MTEEVLKLALKKLGEQYATIPTATNVEFWMMVFDDATDEEFRDALRLFLKSDDAKYKLPHPGQVYHYITKAREQQLVEGLPTVSDALLEVRQTLNRYEGQPKYSHPLITRAVAAIGYYRLCDMNSDDISREFRVTYGELRKHHLDKPVNEHPMVEGRRSGMGSLGDTLGSMSGLLGGRSQ